MTNLALQTMMVLPSLPVVRCPTVVRVAGKTGSASDADALLSEEISATANFSRKRLAEFALGRVCAREILSSMGYVDFPVRVGGAREPLWPAELVGSISHTGEIAVCAVAPQQTLAGIGIDIETIAPESFDLLGIVTNAGERAAVPATLRDSPYLAKLLFSAKESVFKCQFPLTRRWLEFQNVTLMLDAGTREFMTAMEVAAGTLTIRGSWDVTDRYILTVAWVA